MPFMDTYRIVLTVLLDALTFIQVGVQRITIKIILKRGEIIFVFIQCRNVFYIVLVSFVLYCLCIMYPD